MEAYGLCIKCLPRAVELQWKRNRGMTEIIAFNFSKLNLLTGKYADIIFFLPFIYLFIYLEGALQPNSSGYKLQVILYERKKMCKWTIAYIDARMLQQKCGAKLGSGQHYCSYFCSKSFTHIFTVILTI